MDLTLNDEEKLIRKTAAQFVDKELLTREGAYLKQAELFLPPGDPPRRELDSDVRKMLMERARQAGLWALEFKEAESESALSTLARVLIHREFGRTILPFEPPCLPALMGAGNLANRLAVGELSVSLCFDEVHRTGTMNSVQIRFYQEPDGCSLTDCNIDVLDPKADLYLLPAKEQGSERVGLFLIERNIPGLAIEDEVDLTTDSTVARLSLRNCRVSNEQLLGYEYEVGAIIASEQLRIAARSLGMGMRCLASSIEHARNRVTFGRPLAQRQAIQWMLADLSVDLRSCTWLTLEAAWRADHDLPYFEEAALAKKRAARMAFDAADTAIQIHGGYGVCKEFAFEGFYREARLMRLLYGREADMDRAVGKRFLQAGNRH